MKQAQPNSPATQRLSRLQPGAYKLKAKTVSYVYFVTPLMMPAEAQRPQSVFYYPLNVIAYRYPVPVQYPTPPIAVL
jgi:hypothetical protein